MKLKEAIKQYPDGVIHYHDNGAWIFAKRSLNREEEADVEDSSHLYVCEGDSSTDEGYAPSIVVELAEMLGIEVESI